MLDDVRSSFIDGKCKVMQCKRIEAKACAFAGDEFSQLGENIRRSRKDAFYTVLLCHL